MNLIPTGERHQGHSRRQRHRRRLGEIVAVAARYGFAEHLPKLPGYRRQRWLGKSDGVTIDALAPAVRLRLALTDLGTTFIKFGQMLSTRADLVGLALRAGQCDSSFSMSAGRDDNAVT